MTLAYALLQGEYTELWDPARPPHTKYPPVFPALLALTVVLGARTWAALKSVAVLSTIAAVGLTYLWAERRLGPWPAFAVSACVALSSAVVYYGHWVLSDPTFLAFTIAGLWALDRADEEGASSAWLALGVAATGVAYFTRSAGLPLLVALLAWLGLGRRWRPFAAAGVALGVPAFLWWLRARGAGDVQYVSEFWMVDPYQPALGTVGLGGLAGRVVDNAVAYLSSHLPGGIVGVQQGSGVAALGVAVAAAGLAGWARSGLRRPGPCELFLPLYAGLILLWPPVWSGDRFALPLYPVLFVYAGVATRELAARAGPFAARLVAGVALALVLLPATAAWAGSAGEASECRARVRLGGPWACYGARIEAFATAADWSGEALPDGATVMSRKPRIFYVLSGVPSRTFPFDTDPEAHLREAEAAGARYVLLDQWDNLAAHYVGGAVRAAPGSFCAVQGFGDASAGAAQLLGIVQEPRAEAGAGLARCPEPYVRAGWTNAGYSGPSSSSRIPLLDGLRP